MLDATCDHVVLFDAVGTVIQPDPDVVSVYEQLGRAYGSSLSTSELKLRIGQAREKYFNVCPASAVLQDAQGEVELATGDLVSSDEIELRLWRQLVVEVFNEVPDSIRLFEELWGHFSLPQHWRLYEDAAGCWDRLRARGYLIGLASNFDSRLLQLCDSIPLLGTADFVFQSASVGFRKPSPEFYGIVEKELRESIGSSAAGGLRIYMVGDDLVNDCLGPDRAGWSGVWLNRSQESSQSNWSSARGTDGFVQVASLTQFAARLT